MKKITENDFEKVRKYVALANERYPGPTGNSGDQYQARRQAYDEAKPAANFLIEYYFTEIKPDNGEVSQSGIGERPYGKTVTQRALIYFNNDEGGYAGTSFLTKYPTLLEDAIQHYKAAARARLDMALKEPLGTMKGEQLLLLLQEYDLRRSEGYPLTSKRVDESGDENYVYKNPYQTIVAIHEMKDDDSEESREIVS